MGEYNSEENSRDSRSSTQFISGGLLWPMQWFNLKRPHRR
jgi:hypothetical protein